MGWKCDVCDSYNEDRQRNCCVCCQPRSAAAIKEAKASRKKVKTRRFDEAVSEQGYGILKIVFLSGTAAILLCTVVMITIRLLTGRLDEIWQALLSVTDIAFDHLSEVFERNIPLTLEHIANGISMRFSFLESVFEQMGLRAETSVKRMVNAISAIYYSISSHLF